MVIVFAIVPHQLDVVEGLLHQTVLLTPQFFTGSAQIHGIFYDEGIIGEAECCLSNDLPFQSTGDWNS